MPPRKKAKSGSAKAATGKAATSNARKTSRSAQAAASTSASAKRKRPPSDSPADPVPTKAPRVTKESRPRPVKRGPKNDTKGLQHDNEVQTENQVNAATKALEQTGIATKPVREQKQTKKRSAVPPIYDEVWKEVYLAGTEWDQLKIVYSIDWDFDHLDDALTEGELAAKQVFLFGATEPQLLMRDEKDEKGDVIPVPVIVAVVTDVAPPSMVGLKSVQRAEEEIVEMSKLRMGWHAYAPENVSHSRRFKPQVHVLKCNERRARLKNMDNADVHRYDYVLPYFFNPEQVEDITVDTVVQVLADIEGRDAPLMCEYDYEMDDVDEFVEDTLKENELDPSKHTESLKKSIKDAEKAMKMKQRAEKQERQKRINAISAEERDAIKNMKLLKFYPLNDWPDVSKIKSPFINRYYGRATEVL